MVDRVLRLEFSRMPFVRAFLFYVVGIVVSKFIAIDYPIIIGVFVLNLTIFFIVVTLEIWFKKLAQRRFSVLITGWLITLGFLCSKGNDPKVGHKYYEHYDAVFLTGLIVDEPIVKENQVRFPLRIQYVYDSIFTKYAVQGTIMMTIKQDDSSYTKTNYTYGDQLLLPNKLQVVPKAYNPKQFDYGRYLRNKAIYQQGFIIDTAVRVLQHNQGNIVTSQALKARKYLLNKFQRFIIDSTALKVSSALILGYRQEFSPDLLEAFTRTGTIHVLSVSGLHVGIVFYLLNSLLRFLDRWSYGRLFRLCVVLFGVWTYVLLTGMAAAILRAGIMITFFIVSELIGRKPNNLNTLFSSAFFMLQIDPKLLFEVGFQLSYTAVLGLFTFYPLLNHSFLVKNRYLRKLQQYVFISIAAQLLTAPLVLYYFHQFPNYFLLGNLFIAVPSTLLMYLGIGLAASPFQHLNHFLADCIASLNSFILGGLSFIERLPYSIWVGVDFSIAQVLCSYVFLLLLLLAWNNRESRKLLFSFLWMLILIFSVYWQIWRLHSFQGVKIYNMQRDFTLAFFNNGKVFVLSNLDSLQHSKLKYRVWPDIERYAPATDIQFEQITLDSDSVIFFSGNGLKVGLLKQGIAHHRLKDCDLIILRRGARWAQSEKWTRLQRSTYILDASHTEADIQKFTREADSLQQSYYILKDNFSYVWEKQD